MKWTEEYSTGDDEIDRQHRSLFEYTADFQEVLTAGHGEGAYDGFLEFLSAYVKIHFGYEEQCMQAARCPAACRNKKEHGHFLTLLEEETARYQAEGYSHEAATALLDMIDDWLASHILRVDTRLRDSLAGRG